MMGLGALEERVRSTPSLRPEKFSGRGRESDVVDGRQTATKGCDEHPMFRRFDREIVHPRRGGVVEFLKATRGAGIVLSFTSSTVPSMTEFAPIILALPLEETCDEITRAMQNESFVPKMRHRLDPRELGLNDPKKKRGVVVIMDFEPPGLNHDGGTTLSRMEAELCLCQIVCEETDPHYTRVIFVAYEPAPEHLAGVVEDIPAGLASVTQRRLERVHTSLSRRV